MHIIALITAIVLIAALLYGPNVWVTRVLSKYKKPDDIFPGTGAELARHLLDKLKLEHIVVEESKPDQDHYDPQAGTVRLSPDNYSGKSLTAITVAAHEVGHAIQHAVGYTPFRLRHALVHVANITEKLGSAAIIALPLLTLLSRSPAVAGITLFVGIAGLAIGTLVHLLTLPVEMDASFARAMPILTQGNYINESQTAHARKILKAAALTYVAGSLASFLNLYRWIAILRR